MGQLLQLNSGHHHHQYRRQRTSFPPTPPGGGRGRQREEDGGDAINYYTYFPESGKNRLHSTGSIVSPSSSLSLSSSPGRDEGVVGSGRMSCLGAPGYHAPLVTASSIGSPEPNGVDSFITDLLQAVTSDDAPLCSSCEEGISASSRCRDCSELLCDPCVRAHQRVRLTKDHRIIRFNNGNVSLSGTAGSIGSSSRASNSPCSSGTNLCDHHHEPLRLYCETCLVAICTECTLIEHNGHSLIYIQDAVDSARSNGLKLSAETRSAITAVREAIDGVQRMNDSVELRTRQVATEIRTLIKRFQAALETREKDLLTRLEHQRQIKGKALLNQMENLRIALSKLGRTSDLLNESLETGSGLEMVLANERAANELKNVRSVKDDLTPCEDDNLYFIPPDQGLMRAIGGMGAVMSPTVIVGRRAVKERVVVGELGCLRGRPVYGVTGMTVARDNGVLPSLTFGSEGESEGQLCRPWGVCCDKSGNIVVADRSNNRVQIFRPNGSYLRKFGSQGNGPGQFDRPAGVAIDPSNRIIVADKDNHRVQIFTNEGAYILMFGDKGSRNGQFNYPWDVAVNTQSQIVVSDTRNHRIQLFTSDGIFINKYGFESSTTMWKHFDSPRGVCFNPNGSVIVTDFNNHRLVIIDANFTHAQFLGQEGAGFKQFLRPQGIACDDEGRIIVADSRNNRIQVFESNGTFLWKTGQSGKGPGEMDRPSGITVSPEGRIIVVDFGNNRVQVF